MLAHKLFDIFLPRVVDCDSPNSNLNKFDSYKQYCHQTLSVIRFKRKNILDLSNYLSTQGVNVIFILFLFHYIVFSFALTVSTFNSFIVWSF